MTPGKADLAFNIRRAHHLRVQYCIFHVGAEASKRAICELTNFFAPLIINKLVLPSMIARGSGAIVNVAGAAALVGVPVAPAAAAAKAALCSFARSWAAAFGANGIRVNTVAPGPTRTEGTEAMGSQLDVLASMAPAGRPAGPDEIASAIDYLAGDEASFVHGAVLDVDGGRNAA